MTQDDCLISNLHAIRADIVGMRSELRAIRSRLPTRDDMARMIAVCVCVASVVVCAGVAVMVVLR